jgi:hypothetical protein
MFNLSFLFSNRVMNIAAICFLLYIGHGEYERNKRMRGTPSDLNRYLFDQNFLYGRKAPEYKIQVDPKQDYEDMTFSQKVVSHVYSKELKDARDVINRRIEINQNTRPYPLYYRVAKSIGAERGQKIEIFYKLPGTSIADAKRITVTVGADKNFGESVLGMVPGEYRRFKIPGAFIGSTEESILIDVRRAPQARKIYGRSANDNPNK